MKLRLAILCLLSIFCLSPLSAQIESTEDRIAAVENGLIPIFLTEGGAETATLAERMAFHHVPAVSIAVIDDGAIDWAQAWGVTDSTGTTPVTPETIFQVASISKPVSASGILTLVDDQTIALDADVAPLLTSWTIPPTPRIAEKAVTMRGLLSHMAGMTIHGFAGYAVDAELPTLIQTLNGEAPANNPPVVVATVPGTAFAYSGGGYEVAQQVVEDVTGQPFAAFMQAALLDPIGMTHSSYRLPNSDHVALAHLIDGTPVQGGWHVYPEDAAASLWSTPTDLALWALDIRRAYLGEPAMLSQEIAQEMLTRQGPMGLGVALREVPVDVAFEHAGSNLGYRAFVMLLRDSGDGVAILTNGEGGAALWNEILPAVANAYDWPGFYTPTRRRTAVALDGLERYAGTYGGIARLDVRVQGGRLLMDVPPAFGGMTVAYLPESERVFFNIYNDMGDLTFEIGEDGAVLGFEINVPGLGRQHFDKADAP
jgi:CubicO group peptidase (beta-lactamase class C family)